VVIAKMPPEVAVPCAHFVFEMRYIIFGSLQVAIVVAIKFAASLLGGEVAIISTVRTGITCRPSLESAPYLLWPDDR
jgi:hypothetical protein